MVPLFLRNASVSVEVEDRTLKVDRWICLLAESHGGDYYDDGVRYFPRETYWQTGENPCTSHVVKLDC